MVDGIPRFHFENQADSLWELEDNRDPRIPSCPWAEESIWDLDAHEPVPAGFSMISCTLIAGRLQNANLLDFAAMAPLTQRLEFEYLDIYRLVKVDYGGDDSSTRWGVAMVDERGKVRGNLWLRGVLELLPVFETVNFDYIECMVVSRGARYYQDAVQVCRTGSIWWRVRLCSDLHISYGE